MLARKESENDPLSARLQAPPERHCAHRPMEHMDRTATDQTINVLLSEIHRHLDEAARIAKAAETCALTGSDGVSVSMDIEQLIYEGGRLQTPPRC
jgi:hypothetical protein